MKKFMEELDSIGSMTENGALGYSTTGKALVDLNFNIPQMRYKLDVNLFDAAMKEDIELALRWLLYLRDVRGGVGERSTFRKLFVHLCEKYPDKAKALLKHSCVEEFGRWDDLVYIFDNTKDSSIKAIIVEIIKIELEQNIAFVKHGEPISLMAKWMPSENSSSVKTKALAKKLRIALGISSKEYRKTLSTLRSYLNVVEKKMSANEWQEIDYEKVPSKANLIYRNAFERHDCERRNKYLEELANGKAKINANAMFLHDIVHAYHNMRNYDESLEQMWKAQDKVSGFSNTLVVRDGSGSMNTYVSLILTAEEVADAITLYCAENNEGYCKNKFITFSDHPRFVTLREGNSLKANLEILDKYTDYTSTNVEAVFDLILKIATENELSQEEIPERVLVVSDMEFNGAMGYPDDNLFKVIANKYKQAGYKLPKLVFWNVNARTGTIPVTRNENGVILLSGFSKNLMEMVMSSELDPFEALKKVLMKNRYNVVKAIL